MSIMPKQLFWDHHFGNVKVFFDNESETYSLETSVDFETHQGISLVLETRSQDSTQSQYDLFIRIRDCLPQLIEAANVLYKKNGDHLLAEYQVESITLNDTNLEWQLSLIRRKGFEYCHIEFADLSPIGISFSA